MMQSQYIDLESRNSRTADVSAVRYQDVADAHCAGPRPHQQRTFECPVCDHSRRDGGQQNTG